MDLPIEKVTTDDINQRILHSLSRNDSYFISLTVTDDLRYSDIHGNGEEGDSDFDEDYSEYAYTDGGLEWLGYFLSRAKHAEDLTIKGIRASDVQKYKYEIGKFFEGVSLNKSITTLEFRFVDFCGRACFEKLIPLLKNNKLLKDFRLERCNLRGNGGRCLASILSECQSWSLSECYLGLDEKIDDKDAARILAALCMQPNLESLHLKNIQLGRTACVAIANLVKNSASDLANLSLTFEEIGNDDLVSLVDAGIDTGALKDLSLWCTGSPGSPMISTEGLNAIFTLIKSSNFKLCSLRIPGINFDDENAAMFAHALVNNSTLQDLVFDRYTCTCKGWHAISQLLCNTSSIKETGLSNHTLKRLSYRYPLISPENLPHDVRSSLKLNEDNERNNRMKKILIHHPQLDMEPFFEWDFKILPVAVSWFERARDLPRYFEADVDGRKLASIYQFVRGMPDLYIDSCLGLANKKTPATKKPRRS